CIASGFLIPYFFIQKDAGQIGQTQTLQEAEWIDEAWRAKELAHLLVSRLYDKTIPRETNTWCSEVDPCVLRVPELPAQRDYSFETRVVAKQHRVNR
ncbi:MAG: hypothetical protein ACRERV_16165, partial [Methylococcales bacterium]